jgi:hypothetical protein
VGRMKYWRPLESFFRNKFGVSGSKVIALGCE